MNHKNRCASVNPKIAPSAEREWNCDIPRFIPMEMSLDEPVLENPENTAFDEISSLLGRTGGIESGNSVAITVGSRGIGCVGEIVKGVVDAVKAVGGKPFIVPAMGSHGGSDPCEKARILAHLGVTEGAVGAPVSMSGEIVLAGRDENGIPVYCQAEALSADAIILLNRIKPHTDFRGEIESGLVKVACVGLGGYRGAGWVHALGYDHLGERVKAAGEAGIKMLKIRMGLAIIEGHSGRPVSLTAVAQKDIPSADRRLLREARNRVARLPVGKLDVLVVMEMGKDVSGLGLDPLITGRYPSGKVLNEKDVPEIYRIAVLNLTDASEGNASGIGLCDVTTQKLRRKIDFRAMYRNVITSKGSASARLPMVMESDREAICVGLLTCLSEPSEARMILIRNTLHVLGFLASEAVAAECEEGGAKRVGDPMALSFDAGGNLIRPDCLR